MANTETIVTKSTKASVDASTALTTPPISGLIAGENIAACDMVYLKAADGKVYRTTAAAADEKAKILGIAPRQANAGEPITVLQGPGLVAKYSDAGLTKAAVLYLAEAAGQLSSTATTGDAVGVAQAIDTSNIRLTRAI